MGYMMPLLKYVGYIVFGGLFNALSFWSMETYNRWKYRQQNDKKIAEEAVRKEQHREMYNWFKKEHGFNGGNREN